jgi:PAS domain S-box-containing protein
VFESESRRIVEANDAAAALFQTSPEDLHGKSVDCCVIPEERERLAASIGTHEPRWGDVGPWHCVARDGSRFVAQIRFHQTIHKDQLVHVVLATEVVHLEKTRSVAVGNSSPECD